MGNNIFYCVTSYNYQIVSLILFFIGLLGVILSRNLIKVLISLEFIMNAVNLLFISFASYKSEPSYLGYTLVIFTTGISALVLAAGIYFAYLLYKKFGTIDVVKIYDKYKETGKC